MAESCAKSFGRYLKTLRERRGLALDDVGSLSKSYADPVAKSYLSRVENGLLSLALPKMIPLCRIYEIAPEALVERLELDMELDKIGGADTAGLEFGEMVARGKSAYERGCRWDAYAFARDGTVAASQSALADKLRDSADQIAYAWIRVATIADHLGRSRFALHELLGVQSRGGSSPRVTAILLDRLAAANLHIGKIPDALHCADAAIELGIQPGLEDLLGFFYMDRATISRQSGDHEGAIALHQKAFDVFRSTQREIECARSLFALAIAYFHASRHGAARRALAASERFAVRHGQMRLRGLIRVFLGDLEAKAGHPSRAISHWREAIEIGKSLSDKDLQFQATYHVFRHASEVGNEFEARVLRKRLLRMASWLRSDLPELAEFRSVATRQ